MPGVQVRIYCVLCKKFLKLPVILSGNTFTASYRIDFHSLFAGILNGIGFEII